MSQQTRGGGGLKEEGKKGGNGELTELFYFQVNS